MTDFSSLGSLSAVLPPDFNVNNTVRGDNATRIKASLQGDGDDFANQLTRSSARTLTRQRRRSARAKRLGRLHPAGHEQGVTSGRGLGLAQRSRNLLHPPRPPDAGTSTCTPLSNMPTHLLKFPARSCQEFDQLLEEHDRPAKKGTAAHPRPPHRRPRRDDAVDRMDGHSHAEHGAGREARTAGRPPRGGISAEPNAGKADKIRRLAQQNRTLLEHSLFFLQQLFQQVLDRDTPLHLYNLNGHAFSSDLGGGILETRI